jgi:hypothetical protein
MGGRKRTQGDQREPFELGLPIHPLGESWLGAKAVFFALFAPF